MRALLNLAVALFSICSFPAVLAETPAESLPAATGYFDEIEVFQQATVGGWGVEAATFPSPLANPPRIRSIECAAVNNDMVAIRRRDGSVTLELRDRMGERHSTQNIDRLKVGAREFPARAASTRFSDHFDNVLYRPEIALTFFQGYLSIEAQPGTWLPIDYFLRDFLADTPIEARYRDLNSQEPIWIPINTSRLGEAMAWCDASISSDPARLLNRPDSQWPGRSGEQAGTGWLILEFPDGVMGGTGKIQGQTRATLDFNRDAVLDRIRTCGMPRARLMEAWSHSYHVIGPSTPRDRDVVRCVMQNVPWHFNAGIGSFDPTLFYRMDRTPFREFETPPESAR